MSTLQIASNRDRFRRVAVIAPLLMLASACATGSTFRSGVGDRQLESPPYYAGSGVASTALPIARLPIGYQRGGAQAPMFDPEAGAGSPIAALLAEMNAYLDSLGGSVRIAGALPAGTPPDVHFGCNADGTGECTQPDESTDAAANGVPSMRLAVGRPSESWVEAAGAAMDAVGAQSLLVISLEVGQYWTRQKSWRGDKAVELGTNHSVDVPWLTSLDAPVQVLQLTGALMGRDGRAIRIGAEGLIARRTNLALTGFGVQALLSDDDVERVRTLRREDLPGRPLAWQVALRTLVAQLTGQPSLADRQVPLQEG